MMLKYASKPSCWRIVQSVAKNQPRRSIFISGRLGGSSLSTSLITSGIHYQPPRILHHPTCTRFMSHNIDTLRLLTQRILDMDSPLSEKAWSGAETAFDLWTIHPVTDEGATYGWKLLDRLVQDEIQNNSQRITIGWLHRLVNAQLETDQMVDPDEILKRIEAYAPVLQVDDKILEILGVEDSQEHSLDGAMQPMEQSVPEKAADSTPSSPVGIALQHEPTESDAAESVISTEWDAIEQRIKESANDEAFDVLHHVMKDDPQKVTIERFNRIVQHWCDVRIMEPSQLLVKLNEFAPLPDTSTYDIIVTAIQSSSFLDQPLGAMTDADWTEAETQLARMTTQNASPSSVASAWNILDRLVEEERYSKEHASDYEPRLYPDWLNRIVEAWCRCSSGSSTDESTDLLVRINQYAPLLSPDPYIYQMIVNAVKGGPLSGSEATTTESTTMRGKLSTRNKTKMDSDDKYVPIPSQQGTVANQGGRLSNYSSTTLNGYYTKIQKQNSSNDRQCRPEKAEQLLEEMWDQYNAGNESVKPNVTTYNHVLRVWVNSRRKQSGEKAEALLRQMQERSDAGDDSMKPNTLILTSVMSAWSKSGHPGALEKVEAIFDRMKQEYEAGNVEMKPNAFAYTTFLTAIARDGQVDAGERAEAILLEMQREHGVKPNLFCYNAVIMAYTRNDGPNLVKRMERAEALLSLLEDRYQAGDESMRPNESTYRIIITAWPKCEEVSDAADRAEAILKRMENAFEAGNECAQPGRLAYNAAILARIRSNDEYAAQKAELLVDRLESQDDPNIRPNERTFNMVIAAWARQGGESAPLRAEALLDRMKERNLTPDGSTLSKMILVWAKSEGSHSGENALKYLEELHKLPKNWAKREFEYRYELVSRKLQECEPKLDSAKLEDLKQRLERLRAEDGDESTPNLSTG